MVGLGPYFQLLLDSVPYYRVYYTLHDESPDHKPSNVNVETIKYYERRELLSKPDRNKAGYRLFSETAVQDVNFINKSQIWDLPLMKSNNC
ncbi:MerR family DNA-binding transcriptional regulator [Paenibacillaceae bacterium]|nr:MerR family DNA-binding transcriptional regulator [Paenibacillaceae bacterium]